MSEKFKDENPDSYGNNAAKNQRLFDREMSEVVDAPGFNELYEKLRFADVIGDYKVFGRDRRVSIHILKEQSARVIGWLREFSGNEYQPTDYMSLSKSISTQTAAINILHLGVSYVAISEEDVEYCLLHESRRVRGAACWACDLTERNIDSALSSRLNQEDDVVTTIPGIIIEKYAQSLSATQIEIIQLKCRMADCCSLWFTGFGDSPTEKTPGISRAEFFSIFNEEKFLSWRIDYKAGLESARLKEVFVVNSIKDMKDLCNPLIKAQRAL